MEMLQLGPVVLNRQLLAVVAALAAGYAAARAAIRRLPERGAPVANVLLDGLLIGFLVWKAMPAVRDPSLLWPDPLKALMVSGGAADAGIGLVAGLIAVLAGGLLRGVALRAIADAAAVGAAAFLAVNGLAGGWKYGMATGLPWGVTLSDPALRYHPVNLYEALLGLILLAAAASGRAPAGDGRTGARLVPLLGAGLLAVSLTDRHGLTWWLLAPDQWLAAVLAVAGLFLPRLYILWEAVQERRGFPLAKGDSKEKRRQEKKNKRQTRQAEPSGSDKWTGGPNRPAE
jgi:hypothetical protein